jgi:flagellar biosynthesis/type III secretory pathway protein FliH
MNRVLRSPEVSERSVVISVQTSQYPSEAVVKEDDAFEQDGIAQNEGTEVSSKDTDAEDEPTVSSVGGESGDAENGGTRDSADEHKSGSASEESQVTADEGTEESDPEGAISLENVADLDQADAGLSPFPEQTDQDTQEDATLPAPAIEIESIVESRLKEFEERFQQEKEDAYHAGFEDGTNEGMKQGLNQSEDEVVRFQELFDTLTGQWKDTLRTYDSTVTNLAVRIAQKIINVEIKQNNEVVLQAVHDCLAYVEDKTKIIIRVNPNDLDAVRRHRNDWLESLESIDHLLIEAEPTVTQGGCVVDTPIGDVDAQIEERLERLHTALIEEINRPHEDSTDA